MCTLRGPWKTVGAQRFLAARRRAEGEPAASGIGPHAKFSPWSAQQNEGRTNGHIQSGAPSENLTVCFWESISQFFKDNPTWE